MEDFKPIARAANMNTGVLRSTTTLYFTHPRDETFVNQTDIRDTRTEDIYNKLLKRGCGGTEILSNAAPAASTSFAKSDKPRQASTDGAGYLADISFPEMKLAKQRHIRREVGTTVLGYHNTYTTEAFHQGYGEKSARALAREETIYQLKGSFPAALVNFTKLRAQVEARGGITEDIDKLFAAFWGLSVEEVCSVPRLVLAGSEATRLSALEDRAYHSLAGHPGITGGYRVDMATIPPDALGENVPLNWQRLRTTLKYIALSQLSGDYAMASLIRQAQKLLTVRFGMDIAEGSQPAYRRGLQWESILTSMIMGDQTAKDRFCSEATEEGMALTCNMSELPAVQLYDRYSSRLLELTRQMADVVSAESVKSLQRSVAVLIDFSRDRALIEEQEREEFQELERSDISKAFDVPHYKLTRNTLYRGVTRDRPQGMVLPDIVANDSRGLKVNLKEFRESGINLGLDIGQAVTFAIYVTVQRPDVRPYAYLLMSYLPSSLAQGRMKIAGFLRNQQLFDSTDIRKLGIYLFSDAFINTLETILHNTTYQRSLSNESIKQMLWEMLVRRSKVRSGRCPPGDWKNLIAELRDLPEGWSLYYWARISIGKSHHNLATGILAPIAAGEAADFVTLMKKAIRSRTQYWRDYYRGEYKKVESTLADRRYKREQDLSADGSPPSGSPPQAHPEIPRYIPPSRRQQADLMTIYDTSVVTNRLGKYSEEEYQRMVKMQSKSKLYSNVQIYTDKNRIVVGITDVHIREILIEFYQARWLSLSVRIEKAKKKKKVFHLGPTPLPEHPWGEMVEEYPETVHGMLEFLQRLEPVGWTIDPVDLYENFKVSIGQTWDDIAREISQIVQYIAEVESGLADIQDDLVEERPTISSHQALVKAIPIPIPAHGFVVNTQRPNRTLTIIDKNSEDDTLIQVPQNQGDASKEVNETDPENVDGDVFDLDGFDDGPLLGLDSHLNQAQQAFSIDTRMTRQEHRVLSLREIWGHLDLPAMTDEDMRMALTLPDNLSLDEPHMVPTYGPMILESDINAIKRRWAHKVPLIRHRMRLDGSGTLVDDMSLGRELVVIDE